MPRILIQLAVLTGLAQPATAQRTPSMSDSLDLVITGARIVDGSGKPGYLGDIGVQNGWITQVGRPGMLAARPARLRVRAAGLVVAPGFIDVHSHTVDAIIAPERRWNEGVVRQGVTTVLGGPDGGYAPEMMKRVVTALAAQGAGTNVALYVGHNGVRRAVMAADLVIFDPRTIADRSTWEEPGKMAVGVRDVFVNGQAVLQNGELTGRSPGRYLRARR